MSIVLDGTSGIVVSGNTNTLSGVTVSRGAGSVSTNTAVGASALSTNTTGSNSTAVGYLALNTNTSGAPNTALGAYSLTSNTTGTYNVALGGSDGVNGGTLSNNTTGSYNTAIGIQALKASTTANNSTAVGYQALYAATTGGYNTAIGYQAGKALTATGPSGNVVANTLVGAFAGFNLTSGYGNTIVGAYDNSTNAAPGYFITTGNNNTILGGYNGNQGGLDIRTSSNYIVLSDGAGNPRGFFNDSGYFRINNTDAGNYLFRIKFDGASQEAVGLQTSYASGGNMIRFLNSSFTTVGLISVTNTATTYATSSDYRLKENVQPMTSALATVAQLKPVTYKWKTDGADGQGFIAHELQAVVPEAVVGEKDAVDADGAPVYQGIDTSFLVATLTAAIQEQQAIIQQLQADVAALKGN